MDGFILTHAVEGIDVPEQSVVDAFLPPYEPRQVLDPADPVSIGAMVGPEAFEEVRYLAHLRQLDALERIPSLAEAFAEAVGRPSGGLLHAYRTADAETIVVALGSVLGTIKDAVDARREAGERIGVVGITAFRPFPGDAVRAALSVPGASWSSRRPSASASAVCFRPTSRWRPTGARLTADRHRRARRPAITAAHSR